MPNILDDEAVQSGLIEEYKAAGLSPNANFGICFDYAHAALTAISQREWAEKLGKYVRHIHINDNDLQSDLHLAVGDGKIDWNEFYGLYDEYMDKATIPIETSAQVDRAADLGRIYFEIKTPASRRRRGKQNKIKVPFNIYANRNRASNGARFVLRSL